MPAGTLVIGLDVGTSNVKAVAFAAGEGIVAAGRSDVMVNDDAVRHEIDPGELCTSVDRALTECVRLLGDRTVAAIGLTTAMHGLGALDAQGDPIGALLTWADGRATAEAAALRGQGWHRRTGTPVHPMSPFVKLRWFAAHAPDVWAAARRWVGVKELVVAHLTGETVVDVSSASGTGLVALGETDWCAEALRTTGVGRDRLAPIVASTTVLTLSQRAALTGLTPGTPVVVGAGDGPAANLGVGATAPGVAAISLGTSAALRVVVDAPVDPGSSRFVYAVDDGRWVTGGAISNAGAALAWVARLVGCPIGPELDALAAQVPPGSDGLRVLPWLLPERAPHWNPDRVAVMHGLASAHGPGHVVRAVMEGVACHLARVAETLREVGELYEVRATGGGFESPLWSEMIAAALAVATGTRLEVLDEVEGGALGAASLAAVGVGLARDTGDARRSLIGIEGATRPVKADDELRVAALHTRDALRAALGPAGDMHR